MQRRIVGLLKRHLPAGCFSTALENAPRSAISGLLARARGVRAGCPDWMFIWNGKIIFIELKSRVGIASAAQRKFRDELLAAGVRWWWLVRSARAFMVALRRSGVPLVDWERPGRLEKWEGPFADPHMRLPQHPDVAVYRAAARKRSRERQREREAARLAARRHETDFPTTPHGGAEAAFRS
jgi:hypothetical protein